MKRKTTFKLLFATAALILLLLVIKAVILEPWVKQKIQSAINDSGGEYLIEIGNVNISVFRSGIELNNISLRSRLEVDSIPVFSGEIESVKSTGICLMKALFKKDINIGEVIIFNSNFEGKINLSEASGSPTASRVNLRINNLIVDQIQFDIASVSNAQSYALTGGFFRIYDLQVEKLDTLSAAIIGNVEFQAREVMTVSRDSLYTISANDIDYSITSNILTAGVFSVLPNYSNYEFTARHQFEIDRIEAMFSGLSVQSFSAVNYIISGNLISSFIEVEEVVLNVFRDKRREFSHVNKPALQDLIYAYPGKVHIDSVSVSGGSITYREHAEEANEAGMISFNNFKAMIYKISNDPIYKTNEAFLEFRAEALLMNAGRIILFFKGQLFDPDNTFSLNGSLSGMEVPVLNPILENNAFISVRSGKIDRMTFSLTADNTKATGNMKLLYHDLNVAFVNKQTDETAGLKEWFKSFFANLVMINENPKPGSDEREGEIDFERDPEKSTFNYWYKAILSGIKSSLLG